MYQIHDLHTLVTHSSKCTTSENSQQSWHVNTVVILVHFSIENVSILVTLSILFNIQLECITANLTFHCFIWCSMNEGLIWKVSCCNVILNDSKCHATNVTYILWFQPKLRIGVPPLSEAKANPSICKYEPPHRVQVMS